MNWREIREIVVASGATTALHTDDRGNYPDDWSRDGRFIVLNNLHRSASLLPTFGERRPIPLVDTPFTKDEYRFSPDGRWIAYHSTESGRIEVYLASLPSFTHKRQISRDGGGQPFWRADGKELFFLSQDGDMMAVVHVRISASRSPTSPHQSPWS